MKKFLSLLLAVMMLLSCIPAMAEDAMVWRINESLGTLKLYGSSTGIGHVEIPAEVDGVKVMALDYMCFKSAYDITSIIIPDTIRFFERNTLNDAHSLTALVLPRDLIVIKNGSLTDMPLIETLTVPASVSVVNGAFSDLPKMKSITFEGVCPVFAKDNYYGMFVDLPADCVIYVPDDQIDAYKAAFADREDVLARIQPSGKNAVVIDWTAPESDFQFDAATGTITGYTGSASRIDIPAAIGGVPVKSIGKQAFLQKYSLMYVTIPEGIESIEKQAFHGCSLMTYVSFPTTLRTIGDSAFNTNNLVDVGWAEGLESIGSRAFYNCDICYATLPTTLRTIGDGGFENAGFVEVTFGPNVEKIGEKGFVAQTLETMTYTGTTMPTFGADAFKGCTKEATLTLADGAPKGLYDSFVAYLADAFPTCVVNEPANMEMPFPALDVMAGMPFFGNWYAVAGKDVMGDFTNEYPVVTATLNPDGTATVILDGVEMPSAWYVEADYVFLAPVENGKPNAEGIYAMANIDENGRLVIDFFYAAAICEQDGKVYAAPARPEIPWPDLNLDDGKYYVGSWQTADGSMLLTLNEDGTASSVESGEEPYALRWYADYPSAFVGETVNTAFEINFDGNGNIELDMGGMELVLAPYVEATANPTAGAEGLIGDWYDDLGNKLSLLADGSMNYTYASDGWTYEEKWAVVDGCAMVTEGRWAGTPIYMQDGIVFIDNNEGIFQLFSVDGDLSAYYSAGDEYELPEAAHIGAEGEPYFGIWTMDMGGMAMNLTLNQDGTCAMEMMGESEPGVWSVADGKANIMGDELYIDANGALVMESMGMVFTKAAGAEAAPAEPAAPAAQPIGEEGSRYFGTWTLESMAGMNPADFGMTMELTLSMDGTANIYDGYENDQNVWTMENGVAMVDGSALIINDEGKLVMSADGMDMVFVQTSLSTSGGDEMTDEEMMALLALLAQAAGGDAGVSETMQGYVGTWHMCYAATGGLTGDLRDMGIASTLVLNADGTGSIDFPEAEKATWYDDEGTVRFGESGMPMTLLEGGFLQYGSNLGGYLIFHQDPEAVYTPQEDRFTTVTQAPVVTEAPAAAAPSGNFASYEDRLEKKFVAKTYTSFGQTMDASMLGAEYSVVFHANGSCDFALAGMMIPNLPWGVSNVAMGLSQVEAFSINYYGTMFNAVPTDAGFDMDYYGTMTLHFVPAE